jgi:hypothetical protein
VLAGFDVFEEVFDGVVEGLLGVGSEAEGVGGVNRYILNILKNITMRFISHNHIDDIPKEISMNHIGLAAREDSSYFDDVKVDTSAD